MTAQILASELSPYGARLRLAVALKGLDFTFVPPPGGAGSAEVKKLTPFGRVPALLHEGPVLVESLALLEYLEDSQPGSRSLRPADAVQLARVRMIALLFDHNVVKAMGGLFVQLVKPAPDVEAGRAALNEVEAELHKLVQVFDGEGPVVGGQWSIADCAITPFANLIDLLAALFDAVSPTQRVPRFAQWWAAAMTVPEVIAVTQRQRKAFEGMIAAKKAAAAR